MNDLIPIKNTRATAMFVAGRLIQPNETAYFDPRTVPGYFRPPEVVVGVPEPVDPLADLKALLDQSVKNITPKIVALTDDELDQAAVWEGMNKNRQTVLNALTEEQLRRAEIRSNTDLTSVEQYVQVHRVG